MHILFQNRKKKKLMKGNIKNPFSQIRDKTECYDTNIMFQLPHNFFKGFILGIIFPILNSS